MKHLSAALALSALFCTTGAHAVLDAYASYSTLAWCGYPVGTIQIGVTGGTPPYSFLWNDGATTQDRTALPPGTYVVTVTDDLGATDVVSVDILFGTELPVLGNHSYVIDGIGYSPCAGLCDGRIKMNTQFLPGVPPYTVTATADGMPLTQLGVDQMGDPFFGGLCAGQFVVLTVTDGGGCVGHDFFTVDGPVPSSWAVMGTTPACGGASNGSVSVNTPPDPFGMPWYVVKDAGMQVVATGPAPGSTLVISGLPAGTYDLFETWTGTTPSCQSFISGFIIAPIPQPCGSVEGTVFIDNDQDCTQDPGEVPVPYRVLTIQPGPEYAITNMDGSYARALADGSYTLEVQGTGVDLYPICPAVQPAPFTINQNAVTLDIADSSLIPLDVNTWLGTGPARPGFQHAVYIGAKNLSAQLSGPLTVTLTLDPQLTFAWANPAPSTVVGNVVTWSLVGLSAYEQRSLQVWLDVPPNPALIGLPWSHTVSVTQPLTEVSLTNNTSGRSGVFTGSFDPNDKTVRTSTGWSDTQYIIGDDEWLEYVVRFQNTGTDTAFTVVVTDSLEADLDMGTYEQGVASHPFTVSFKPGRVVEWRFANILLPDSNTNESLSHGLVSFRIRPVQPVLPGTEYRNSADIFFDLNPAVRTDDVVVVAEMSTQVPFGSAQGTLQVFPNPGTTYVQVASNIGVIEQLRVVSVDGRLQKNATVRDRSGSLDVSEVPAGTYIIVAAMEGGAVLRSTFVKY